MASVFKIEMNIVSEFVNYNEQELHTRLTEAIKEWKDKESGLGLLPYDMKVTRINKVRS